VNDTKGEKKKVCICEFESEVGREKKGDEKGGGVGNEKKAVTAKNFFLHPRELQSFLLGEQLKKIFD